MQARHDLKADLAFANGRNWEISACGPEAVICRDAIPRCKFAYFNRLASVSNPGAGPDRSGPATGIGLLSWATVLGD
jgi:hypothetical protein